MNPRVLSLFMALVLCGCGQKTGSVSGRITYQDRPLTFGRVTLFAVDNSVHSAQIGSDGSYAIPKVPVGPAKITVETPDLRKMPESHRGMMDPARMGNPQAEKPGKLEPRAKTPAGSKPVFIPDQYASLDRSGLSLDVQAGENTFDIPLK
jgi:hypothetical protein